MKSVGIIRWNSVSCFPVFDTLGQWLQSAVSTAGSWSGPAMTIVTLVTLMAF